MKEVIQMQTRKGNWKDTTWIVTGACGAFNKGNESPLEVARRIHPRERFRLIHVIEGV